MNTLKQSKTFALALMLATLGLSAHAQGTDIAAGTQKADSVIASLRTGKMEPIEAMYSPEMKKATAGKGMAGAWTDIKNQLGELKTCEAPKGEVRDIPVEGSTRKFVTVAHPCQFEKAPFNIITVWDEKGQLAGFFMRPLDK